MKTKTYILPTYWASALINDDWSGIEGTEDEQLLNTFLNMEYNDCEGNAFVCIDVSDESYFSWHNDATKYGGDVSEYTFRID